MTPEVDWLRRWSLYSKDKVALKSGEEGRELSYGDLYHQVLRLSHHLNSKFQIGSGDRVACLATNVLEYVSLFYACQRLGAILVPLNFRFQPAELDHILQDSGAKLLVAQHEFWSKVEGLARKPELWSFDQSSACLVEIAQRGEVFESAFNGKFEDPCMILYTSGTTGFPKGAIISHRMMFWNSINTGLRLNLTEEEVVLTFLPLFHTGGWNVLTTPCLHRGAKVVLLNKFDADLVLDLCETEKVTVLFGVPTTMDLLRRSTLFKMRDLKSLRFAIVGGEPLPLELIDVWENRGVPIRQGYGLTEFGPNVFSLSERDSRRKAGSIGFPNFYVEAKVVDSGNREVAANEIGELILRGPMCMTGYWGDPDATKATIQDGWLYTGDLVRCDEEGYFFVVGRKKEMFISGGENVYPVEVERVLKLLANVREVAVIGIPNSRWGEVGRAYVSFEPNAAGKTEPHSEPNSELNSEISSEDLREHCLKFLAKFKVPAEFVVLPELPKTDSGKIAKNQLLNLHP